MACYWRMDRGRGVERAASGISFREDRGYQEEGLQTDLNTYEGEHLLCLILP